MFIRELVLIALIVSGGVGASQIPQFVQEYEQRLGGASDEASRQLAEYDNVARQAGMVLSTYIALLKSNSDQRVIATGETISKLQSRAQGLRRQRQDLSRSARLLKPLILARLYDHDLLTATWAQFRLNLLLDPIFGILGLILGWLIHMLLWAGLGAIFAPPRRRRY